MLHTLKKIFAAALAVVLLAPALATPAAAMSGYDPDFEVTAEAAYIVNLDTNLVVYEKNSETPLVAGSLTKLMTMILLLKNYQDQLDTITVTAPGYIYDYLYGKGASSADIRRGETHTLRTLLYAMEVQSGNEAAYIVADYMGGGSIDNFVAMMERGGRSHRLHRHPPSPTPAAWTKATSRRRGIPTCCCALRWSMTLLSRQLVSTPGRYRSRAPTMHPIRLSAPIG